MICASSQTERHAHSDPDMAVVVLPLNDGLEPLVVTIKPQVGTESHQQHTTIMCGMVDQNGHQQTAKSEATHCLVQELAICQCMLEPSPANILTHGAGENNTPKAIASRAITQIDDDTAFVTHHDTLFSSQGGLTLVWWSLTVHSTAPQQHDALFAAGCSA